MMGKLTEEQLQSYDTNGYLVIDVLNEQELEELSNAYNTVFESKIGVYNLESTWEGNWRTSKENTTSVQSIHGLQTHSAAFTKVLLNDRLLDACESIMKTPNILLHHTKAHTKPPGKGSPFPMHQDYPYMAHKNDSLIAALIAVDDCKPSNGGMCVYPGSHKLGPQEDVSDTKGFHYLDPKKFPLDGATPVTLKRGQALIFSYLTIHGSYPNESSEGRRMLLIQFMAAEDEPLDEAHLSASQGLVLRGFNPKRSADIADRVKNIS